MLEVLNMYTNIFGFETSGSNSPRANQGFLEKDPKCELRLSKNFLTYG